jgi:hypothetical protein
VLISTVVSTILSLAAIMLFRPFGIRSIPAGPYGIIFSLYVLKLNIDRETSLGRADMQNMAAVSLRARALRL